MLIITPPIRDEVPVQEAEYSLPDPPMPRFRERTGTTAMEYCVMASLIITVLVIAIQNFGRSTNDSLEKSSKAAAGISSSSSPSGTGKGGNSGSGGNGSSGGSSKGKGKGD